MTFSSGFPYFQGPTTVHPKPPRTKIRDFAYLRKDSRHRPINLQEQGSTRGLEREVEHWRTHPEKFEKRGWEIRETGPIADLIKAGKWAETPEHYSAVTLRGYRRTLRNKVEPEKARRALAAQGGKVRSTSQQPLNRKTLASLSPESPPERLRARSRVSETSQNSQLTPDFMVGISTGSQYSGSQRGGNTPLTLPSRSLSPFQVPQKIETKAKDPLAPMVEAQKRKFDAHPEWLTMDKSRFNVEVMPQLKASVCKEAGVAMLREPQHAYVEDTLRAYRSELMSKQ
jgi:hypothetical protein